MEEHRPTTATGRRKRSASRANQNAYDRWLTYPVPVDGLVDVRTEHGTTEDARRLLSAPFTYEGRWVVHVEAIGRVPLENVRGHVS